MESIFFHFLIPLKIFIRWNRPTLKLLKDFINANKHLSIKSGLGIRMFVFKLVVVRRRPFTLQHFDSRTPVLDESAGGMLLKSDDAAQREFQLTGFGDFFPVHKDPDLFAFAEYLN